MSGGGGVGGVACCGGCHGGFVVEAVEVTPGGFEFFDPFLRLPGGSFLGQPTSLASLPQFHGNPFFFFFFSPRVSGWGERSRDGGLGGCSSAGGNDAVKECDKVVKHDACSSQTNITFFGASREQQTEQFPRHRRKGPCSLPDSGCICCAT